MPLLKAKEKKERALGAKLFLKADRCSSPKCVMIRRPYRPGQHGKGRRRPLSEFGTQLLEKQRIKISYGLTEAQFEKIFKEALSRPGNVSDNIMRLLELQLANVLYRSGLAGSRIIARQLITHGHIMINNKKTRAPSYQVKINETVSVNPASHELLLFKDLADKIKKYESPAWLLLDKEKLEAKVKELPHNIEMPFDINMVVDYYSK